MDRIEFIFESIVYTLTNQTTALAFQSISNIVTAISALIVTIIAIKGLNEWKQQIKYSKRFELAEELTSSFHEVEISLIKIRSSLVTHDEKHDIQADPEFKDSNPNNTTTVFLYRLKQHGEPIKKFLSLQPRFELTFRKETNSFFDDFQNLYKDIMLAAGRLSVYENQSGTEGAPTPKEIETSKKNNRERALDYLQAENSDPDPVKRSLEVIKNKMDVRLKVLLH